jgi:hypothetical protein
VPHVRLSVRGPNKTGEAHHCFPYRPPNPVVELEKAIETYHFRPTYAEANVGTRPVPIGLSQGTDCAENQF